MSVGAFRTEAGARRLLRMSAAQREAIALRLQEDWRGWCASWSLVRAEVRVEPLVQGTVRWTPPQGWRPAGRHKADGTPSSAPSGITSDVWQSGLAELLRLATGMPASAQWQAGSLAAAWAGEVEASFEQWRDGWLGALARDAHVMADPPGGAAALGAVVVVFACEGRATSGAPLERIEYALCTDLSLMPGYASGHADGVPGRRGSQVSQTIQGALGSQASSRAAPASRPLVPLSTGIAHLPVRVSLRLGQAAMHMGELLDLAPGDVVRLDHDLAHPARLTLDAPLEAPPLAAQALLGQQAGHWAVRLVPLQDAPTPTQKT